MGEGHIHAEARHLEDEGDGHGHGLEVGGGVGPGDDDLLLAQIAPLLFLDGHQIGETLEGMEELALHIEHGGAGGFGDPVDVLVAVVPVALADGDAVEVTAQNIADLLGGVAVGHLRRLRVDEGRVPAQLGHAGLEGAAGAGAAEEEQHAQGLVAQIGMGFAHRPLALEIPGHIQYGFDLFFGEIKVADQVAAT